jgi:hypothetical protein
MPAVRKIAIMGRHLSLITCFLAVICLSAMTPTLAADRFVSGIADLPLMLGLEEVDGSAVVFSKPEGRIVEVTARGNLTPVEVHGFYNKTLPQLGWRLKHGHSWQRENELLQLDLKREKSELVVQFSLSPR